VNVQNSMDRVIHWRRCNGNLMQRAAQRATEALGRVCDAQMQKASS
jgi:hypothetical protein